MFKVDIDEHAELAMEYDVSAIPAVYGLRDGKVIDKFIGSKGDNEITEFIQTLTKSNNK